MVVAVIETVVVVVLTKYSRRGEYDKQCLEKRKMKGNDHMYIEKYSEGKEVRRIKRVRKDVLWSVKLII